MLGGYFRWGVYRLLDQSNLPRIDPYAIVCLTNQPTPDFLRKFSLDKRFGWAILRSMENQTPQGGAIYAHYETPEGFPLSREQRTELGRLIYTGRRFHFTGSYAENGDPIISVEWVPNDSNTRTEDALGRDGYWWVG